MSRQPKSLSRTIWEAAAIVVLVPLIVPWAAVALVLFSLHRIALYLLVWVLWLPKGKDILLVYSDSPIWHAYMTEQVLPLVEGRAIVLNWSERKRWGKWWLSQHVFRSFGGYREFNPIVVLFRPFRRARLFRFWSAFKDWKRGYTEPVERLRNDLRMSL